MEIKVQATESNIIPFYKPEEKEIEVVKWVNQPNILARNAKAKEYIETCAKKRKEKEETIETIGYFVSGIFVFIMPFTLYILATLF